MRASGGKILARYRRLILKKRLDIVEPLFLLLYLQYSVCCLHYPFKNGCTRAVKPTRVWGYIKSTLSVYVLLCNLFGASLHLLYGIGVFISKICSLTSVILKIVELFVKACSGLYLHGPDKGS